MSGATAPLALPERFVIGTLPALKEEVTARRAAGAPVVLDAAAVRSVDSAALQFLIVCHATRAESESGPLLAGAGETLEKALADVGADALLEP